MRKLLGLTIFSLFLPCLSLSAEFYGSFDALYWTADHSPVLVARERVSPEQGTNIFSDTYADGEWSWGARFRLGFCECDKFYDISYLNWSSKEETHLGEGRYGWFGGAPGISGQNGDGDNYYAYLNDKTEFSYQNIDFRFGKAQYDTCNMNLCVYGNLRWADIEFKHNESGLLIPEEDDPIVDYYQQNADFQGLGFGLGVGGQYCLTQCFTLVGHFGVTAMYGSSDINENYATYQGSISHFSNGQSWDHFVPAFDFRLGVEFTMSCFYAQIGWEQHYYHNVLRASFDESLAALESGRVINSQAQDIGFGGLYLSLGASF